VAAALIEPTLGGRTVFRVTLPSPLQLRDGARLIIDSDPPISGAFFTGFANGCMADYAAAPELMAKLKSGQLLLFQATNLAAKARSVCMVRLTVERATSFSSGPWSSLPAPRLVVVTRRSLRTLAMSCCLMS
jgi:hypothetical protein